jgi:hypothetical protein
MFEPLANLKDFDRSASGAAQRNSWHTKFDTVMKRFAAAVPSFYHPLNPPIVAPSPTNERITTAGRPRNQAVIATGGGYFFAPARAALRDVLIRTRGGLALIAPDDMRRHRASLGWLSFTSLKAAPRTAFHILE